MGGRARAARHRGVGSSGGLAKWAEVRVFERFPVRRPRVVRQVERPSGNTLGLPRVGDALTSAEPDGHEAGDS